MISHQEQPGGPERERTGSPKPKVESPKPKAMGAIDSANHFEVVKTPSGVAIKNAPLCRQVLSKDQAVSLAAWLMVLADPTGEQFERVVKEIVKG